MTKTRPNYRGLIPLQWAEIVEALEKLVREDPYLSWAELIGRQNPHGISHEAWWAALKICRLGQTRSLELKDETGTELCFATPATATEILHRLDRIQPDAEAGPEEAEMSASGALVMEAVASARLAGSATTLEEGKEMLRTGRPARNGDEQMIINTHAALQFVQEDGERLLTPGLVAELHRGLTQGLTATDEDGDLFRLDSEGPAASAERKVSASAEGGSRNRLDAMCAFANGQAPDHFVHPIIRGIVLHFWLAHERPFSAANGRTARALFYWVMRRQAYGLFRYLALSPVLLSTRERYRSSFLESAADDNDLTYFILAQLSAIAAATQAWRDGLVRKKDELQSAARRLQGFGNLNPRQQSLVAHALRHPDAAYVIAGHQRSHGVTHQTARDDLFDLVDREILTVTRERRVYRFRPAAELAGGIQSAGGRRRGTKAGVAAETLPTALL